jgi:hypothetical protein
MRARQVRPQLAPHTDLAKFIDAAWTYQDAPKRSAQGSVSRAMDDISCREGDPFGLSWAGPLRGEQPSSRGLDLPDPSTEPNHIKGVRVRWYPPEC